jgi:hypothetical protein
MELMMFNKEINLTRFLYRIASLMLIILAAYGCAATPSHFGPQLSPAPLPTYEKGTTFIYSNGAWETVTATSQGLVTWQNHRRNISSGSPDFTYRRANWQTKTRQGTRQIMPRQDLLIQRSTSLWPLQIGNVASFSEKGNWSEQGGLEKSSDANWFCEVVGTERLAVMVGEFDTYKIDCKRYSTPQNPTRARVRQLRTWYYAPAIEHYVLKTTTYYYDKRSRRQELLAVLPPLDRFSSSARRRMDASFQHAMEFKKSGESVPWSIPSSTLAGDITPTGTFRLADGSFSRRYIQKLKLPDGQRTYYGMAVRNVDGVWVVPRRR